MSENKFIAPDGGMSLKPYQFREPYAPGLPPTPVNDNMVLYLTIYFMLKREFDWVHYLRTVGLTKHKSIPGLYHRNPGRNGAVEGFEHHAAVQSHDNLQAMACAEIISGKDLWFKDIIKHWPVINNVSPGQVNWESINTRTPSGIMPPASWFLFYLAAGKQPGWISTIAYCISILVTAFVYKHYTHHSEHIRAWMTNTAVNISFFSHGNLTEGKSWLVRKSIELFNARMLKKSGGVGIYFRDFIPEHPINKMGTKLK